MKRWWFLLLMMTAVLAFCQTAFAEKVVIVYTGETHADLYPCHCPVEPFGGLARRAAKIKELRKTFPDLLLVDSGGFFAGGQLDEYSVNETIDKQRTEINLNALKIMGYNALAIGDEELSFGKDFLEKQIERTKLPFLSCNIKVKGAQNYLLKTVAGIKIGILAVTPNKREFSQITIAQAVASVKSSVEKLINREKAAIIILLSHLGEQNDAQLLQQIKGIDFLITGHSIFGRDKETKINNGVLIRPAWQGRKLGKLELDIEKGKLKNYSADLIGLGNDVSDDAQVAALLPHCFSDGDCHKPGLKGQCQNPGSEKAQCSYEDFAKIPLLVIQPRDCRTCNSAPFLNYLKNSFPGIKINFLDQKDELAEKLIRQFSVNMLPAYFIGKQAEKEIKQPEQFGKVTLLKGDYYWFLPSFSGISYFMDRPFLRGKLDLFITLGKQDTPKILETVKIFLDKHNRRFKFQLHFVVWEDTQRGFISPMGAGEIEEDKIALCVGKYMPAKFWGYMFCRSGNMKSNRWEDCLKIDEKNLSKIEACAKGNESKELLRADIVLTNELRIPYGPLFLLENKEVFGIAENTSVEELERFILGNKQK
ncbi:MAG: hypothetical protein Q8N14_02905 [Candidatus Omnitrophota bacterium]|nr:hypothetical protein [Candidatus Omnitrophota bacterium]